MISSVLSQHHQQFSALAQTWLGQGAASFGVWHQGRPLCVWPGPGGPPAASLRAPIVVDERVVGHLGVAGLDGPGAAARLRADALLVAGLVRQAEQLHQANLLLGDSHDRMLAVYEAARGVYGHENVEQLLRWLLREAMRLVHAAGGFVLMVPSAAGPLLITQGDAGLSEDQIWGLYWRSQAEADPGQWALEARNLPPAAEGAMLVAVALERGGTLLLGLINHTGGQFSGLDYQVARAVAHQAGAQVAYVLLTDERLMQARLQAELELARRVQALLMPQRLPSVAGLDIYGRGRAALPVGGDFYDFIEHPGRPFVFSVGDVAGKGLSAAMLMTMTRGAIHSKASFMPEPTPASVVRNSNIDLCEDFHQLGAFATALVGQYRAERRELLFTNAGHSPVIYRPAGGRAELLRAENTPLGLLDRVHCENQALRLAAGDLLVVGTDGLNDARDPQGARFGYERLLEVVERHAPHPAAWIGDALFEAVSRFSGTQPQEDDQTVVVIKGTEV